MRRRGEEFFDKLGKKGKVFHIDPKISKRAREDFMNRIKNPSNGMSEQVKEAEEKMKDFCCTKKKKKKCKFQYTTKNNGIYGPGGRSWITDSYYVCEKCSVRFENPTAFTNAKKNDGSLGISDTGDQCEKDVNQNFDGHC